MAAVDVGVKMPTGAEELAAGKAALSIVQMADRHGWFDRLKEMFKTKHRVLILGSSGVGKSNFVASLHHLVPSTIDSMNRTPVVVQRRLTLDGKVFDIDDSPGQKNHEALRTDLYVDALKSGDPFGIINVVCAGYHEYLHGADQALAPDRSVNPSWLETHRELELRAASEWVPLMTARPRYVLTLVNKADLWWSDRNNVLRSYESDNEPYWRTIKNAAINGHLVLPFSSVSHPFYSEGGLDGTFGTSDRTACLAKTISSLFELNAKW